MIVLDTSVLVWWVSDPEHLSNRTRRMIAREKKINGISVSSISIWEICLLVQKGRLRLSMDVGTWIEKIEQLPLLQFVPVDNRIAQHSVDLPEPFHADPADRMIVATARVLGATLVTSDRKILRYPHVQTVW